MTHTSIPAPQHDADSRAIRVAEPIDGRRLLGPPDPTTVADPYPRYACLRAEDAVHRTPDGLWILTRHADVAAVLRNLRFGREGFERHFGASRASTPTGDGLARATCPAAGGSRQSMLFRDPPHHTRLRDAVSRAFTPRAVEALRPRVAAHVDDLLDRVAASGRMDVVADLAEPLARAVIGELLGIPELHRGAFAVWSAAVARSLDALPIPEDRPLVAEGEVARRALGRHVRQLVARHRDPIWSDLQSRVVDVTDSGALRAGWRTDLTRALVEAADEDGLLTDSELVAMIVLLLVAGTETTVSSISTTVHALLAHPDEIRRLREAPWLLPAAA